MTLARRIIPCLDVDAGRVVKGVKFRDLRDVGDPVELAVRYAAQGADEVVFLDITASHEKRDTMLDVVRRTAENLFIPLTVGGGIRSSGDMSAALNAGADKVAVNTAALHEPDIIDTCSSHFGAQCVVVAVDAKKIGPGKWSVFTHGGRTDVGRDAIEWCKEAESRGAGEILLTSMDADGTRNGYDRDLLRAIIAQVDIPVIASGGCGSPEHIVDAFLWGADAALAASIFHDGDHSVGEVKRLVADAGIPVRPVAR